MKQRNEGNPYTVSAYRDARKYYEHRTRGQYACCWPWRKKKRQRPLVKKIKKKSQVAESNHRRENSYKEFWVPGPVA